VSSFDDHDLGQQVGQALAAITSGAAPAATIVAEGRRIRSRRRAALAGAVAVVAALAMTIPGLLHSVVRGGPPGPPGRPLTINKLGPIARHDVIGSGTLNGKPWAVRLTGGPGPAATAAGLPVTGHLGISPGGSDPVTFQAAGSGAQRLLAGPVRPDVTYLTMQLAGGTTYRLYPVSWHGHRYVGLVVPWSLHVTRFTAYSAHGELTYAIPFPRIGDFPLVVSWLRPGAAVPAESSATVARRWDARLNNGWSVQVEIGPWGTCLLDQHGYLGSWCRPTVAYPPNAVTLVMSSPSMGEAAGITGSAVAYLQLWLRSGKTTRLHVLHIGGQGFYALPVLTDPVARWTAYTTTAHPIASGTGTPG
jgi:hypothetical protein